MSDHIYILQNKDTPLMEFRCDRDADGNPVFVETGRLSDKLPFNLDQSDSCGIKKWLKSRRAPKNRAYISELLTQYNCNDLEGYVRFTACAGLNDTFWVKPAESNISWQDVSPYTNRFDTVIANLAFDGSLSSHESDTTSPEFSTDGNFAKCWIRRNDTVYLLKRGTSGASNAGLEPFSELFAYDLGKNICESVVDYTIVKHHNKIASRCPLFTSEKIAFAPIANIAQAGKTIDAIMEYYDALGEGDRFRQMMVLDALTLNPDRHRGNFGVLYDADSLKIARMAPVFDNNLSFVPYTETENLDKPDLLISKAKSSLGYNPNEMAIKCLTPGIASHLKALKGFAFSDSTKSQWELNNADRKRLGLLEQLVDRQIDNILERKVVIIKSLEEPSMMIQAIHISIDKKALDDVANVNLSRENVEIGDFELIFESGKRATITGFDFDVNDLEDGCDIDIFASHFTEDVKETKIIDMTPIPIGIDKQQNPISVSPKTLEFEFLKGSERIYFEPKTAQIVLAQTREAALENINAPERKGLSR